MQEGKWLSEINNDGYDAIPVIVYDVKNNFQIGDILRKTSVSYTVDKNGNETNTVYEIKLTIVGMLDEKAEMLHYNHIENRDCRDTFSTVKSITEKEGYETLYFFRIFSEFFRSEDIRKSKTFLMSSDIAFINVSSDEITTEMKNENQTIILGITDNFCGLNTFKENSIQYMIQYMTEEINKLLPIFVCMCLLTIMGTSKNLLKSKWKGDIIKV